MNHGDVLHIEGRLTLQKANDIAYRENRIDIVKREHNDVIHTENRDVLCVEITVKLYKENPMTS